MKKIVSLITVFALALSLTAGGEDKEAQPEKTQSNGNDDFQAVDDQWQDDDNQQDWNDNSDMMQNNSQDIKLSVAQIAERDFIFVLKASELEKYMALDQGINANYYINFGENNQILMSPNETSGNLFRVYLNGVVDGDKGYDCLMTGKMEGDMIKMIFRVPEEAGFDWSAINEFEVDYPVATDGAVNSMTVKKADAEVDPATLGLPTPLSELSTKNANISISTKDNSDGTITITYNDSTVKPEYIYPWEWFEKDSFAYSNYRITIQGKSSEGDVLYASLNGDGKKLGSSDTNYESWDSMIFSVTDLLKKDDTSDSSDALSDVASTIDENGMTLVWTVKPYDGRIANEITEFAVELDYYVSGSSYSEQFVTEWEKHNLVAVNGTTTQ